MEKSKIWEKQLSTGYKFDGWKNVITEVGGSRDPLQNYFFVDKGRLDYRTLNSLYKNSTITQKIIDIPANDITREDINFKQTDNPEDIQIIKNEIDRLEFFNNSNKAIKQARLHGGALWVPDIKDSSINGPNDLKKQLDPENIKEINQGFIIDKEYITPLVEKINTQIGNDGQPLLISNFVSASSEPYSQVTHYRINNIIYHKSRVFVFEGKDAGTLNRQNNNGWNEPIINYSLYLAIIAYTTGHNKIVGIFDKFIQSAYYIEGLKDSLDNDCEGATRNLKSHFSAMEMVRSIFNALVFDKEDSFEVKTANISGIKELISNPERHLVTLSFIPHTRLLGEAPAASIGAASGTAELIEYYDMIASLRKNTLTKPLNKFINMVKGLHKIKNNIFWEYKPLYQQSEKEQSETNKNNSLALKTKAEMLSILINEVGFSFDEIAAGLQKNPELMRQFNLIIDNEGRAEINNLEVD